MESMFDRVVLGRLSLVLIIVSFITGTVKSSLELDCANPTVEETSIQMHETDPIGTDVLLVYNSSSRPHWVVSYNHHTLDYLSTFFVLVQGEGHTNVLRLKKFIDLELLQVEHPPSMQLPDFSDEDLTLQLQITCQPEDGELTVYGFNISVLSVNEFSPYFLGAPFSVSLSEAAVLGTEVYDLSSKAVDLDAGKSQLTFNIAPYIITEFDGRRWVTMDSNKNGRIVLSRPLDFEKLRVRERAYFFLNVTVTDDGGYTTATSIQVGVQDANDQSIEFIYPNCSRPCTDVNYTTLTNESYVGTLNVLPVSISSRDLDTLNSTIEYQLLSDDGDFFSVDRATGLLSKTAALINDTYGYNISLLIEAREVDDHSHSLQTEVIVLIWERRPSKGIHHVHATKELDQTTSPNFTVSLTLYDMQTTFYIFQQTNLKRLCKIF